MYRKQYYQKHKEHLIEKQKDYYLSNKDIINHKAKLRRLINKEEIKKQKKLSYQKIKNDIFDYYGRECVKCGETSIEFLELDHINGKGCEHLKAVRTQGKLMHQWIIKNNYPPIFQVLCCNCNWKKHLSTLISSNTQYAIYSKTAHRNLRIKVFNILGNTCICCGEADLSLLTVEHKFNDGKLERKLYGREGIYRRISNNLVDLSRYETLCRNCNFAKGRNGYCPHTNKIADNIIGA